MSRGPGASEAAAQYADRDPDQRIIMNGIDWSQYETMLAIRGDRAGAPRPPGRLRDAVVPSGVVLATAFGN